MSERYADIAMLVGSPQDSVFTYAVPEEMDVRRGMAVVAPWRTQWALGVVIAVTAETDLPKTREIERILDPEPLMTAQQLELAAWIAERYLASLASCIQLFLPPGTPSRPRRSPDSFSLLVPGQPAIPKLLVLAITATELRETIDAWPHSKRSRPARLLDELANGELTEHEATRIMGSRRALDDWLQTTSLASRLDHVIRLSVDSPDARTVADSLRRTAAERRQLELLRLLTEGELEESEAKRRSDATRADIDRLVAAGVLNRVETMTPESETQSVPAPQLTAEQLAAVGEVVRSLDEDNGEVYLLHGVTGSGKTEVYLAAADHALARGGSVIVLVPEIALAPQTIARFEARFPEQVAVRHSGLSRSESREQWRQVYEGKKRILIGARSALFGPMPNLSLVVVDEEHEWTYKQTDPQPRYHAGTVAREMARSWGAVAVLGSATPDVVSMADARSSRSRLLTLTHRVQSGGDGASIIPQPAVDIVDLREELAAGVRSVFGRQLDAAISEALIRDEQVLLFLNRRGMSSLVCRACGQAVECRQCSIAMTLHQPGPYLRCHECGERQPSPLRCPSCNDERIGAMSFGTAQLEAELRRRWGDVPITRWDRDTSTAPGSHAALLEEFAEGRSRVLIGTQMIAKGLDLPRVTVAGVINADLSLRESDYLASERTFQVLSQVAGRAGRGAWGGRVIIQTYSPDHFAVVAAAAHDYEAFYQEEMRFRSATDHPPYGRLARLTVTRATLNDAEAEARMMVDSLIALRARTPGPVAQIFGPSQPYPARRQNRWRQQILLKGDDPRSLLRQVELGRGWSVDVDPVA